MKQIYWLRIFDGLLPLSVLLFLLPFNPQISTLPALLWLIGQYTTVPSHQRGVFWPLLSLTLLGAHIWWFNLGPSPASFADAALLVISLLAGSVVAQSRWTGLLKTLLVGVLPLIAVIGSKPWNPNPFVGTNQSAYLIGFSLIICVIWALQTSQHRSARIAAIVSSIISFCLVWQTGSRAALVASCFSVLVVLIPLIRARFQSFKPLAYALLVAILAYIAKWQLFSSSSSLPGVKAGSDVGRLLAAQCYAQLPFTGNNRLLWGVGFDRLSEFCTIHFQASELQHSHNLYLQIWSATGVLGLLATLVLLMALFAQWRQAVQLMPPFVSQVGQASLVYVLVQGVFDLSLLHWPVTIVLTGMILSIPISYTAYQSLKSG